MKQKQKPTWTQERVETLLHLAETNCSAKMIASILCVSRNAVIGKLHRLKQKDKTVPEIDVRKKIYSKPKKIIQEKVLLGIPMIETDKDSCMYPLQDGSFCGKLNIDGFPYCQEHKNICYRKIEKKNKKGT